MKINSRILTNGLIAAALLCPATTFAEIVINEIAWMGGAGNANAEWIELHNTNASPVSLEGWALTAEDGSPTITLLGTIGGNGFFLLERTSDESVPGITAELIYTGVLGNAGETLVLKNASGQSIDTVSGGENWQNIGGDNTTKETAQRTANGWTTSTPTPRAANAVGGSDEAEDEPSGGTNTETSPPVSAGGGNSTPAPSSASVAKANAGKDRVVIVGVDNRFEGIAYDSGNRIIESASFSWNFGDGTVAEGKTVIHRWQYPGRYAVVLEVSRFESKASHRITVTVESPQLSFEVSQGGDVIITNLSRRDIDLSEWRIHDTVSTFTFSPNTIVLPSASIRLAPLALRFNASQKAELLYPDGSIAAGVSPPASAEVSILPTVTEEEEQVHVTSFEGPKIIPGEVFPDVSTETIVSIEEIPELSEEPELLPENIENAAAAALSVEKDSISLLWWLGLILLVGLGVGAIFAARHLRPKKVSFSQKDWNIIDDTDKEV